MEQAAREVLHSTVSVKADSGALEALARSCDERAGAQAAALATLQQEVAAASARERGRLPALTGPLSPPSLCTSRGE